MTAKLKRFTDNELQLLVTK